MSESRLVGRCQHDSESHAGSLTPMAKVAERRKLGRRGSDRDVPVTPFPSLFLGAQGVKRAEGERRRRGRRGRAAGRRDGGTSSVVSVAGAFVRVGRLCRDPLTSLFLQMEERFGA